MTGAKWLADRHTPTLEQETLAEFIASGAYERHLRRARRANAIRRDVLLESIEEHLSGQVSVTGERAGTHVVLWPKSKLSESEIVQRAAAREVGVYGISGYYLGRAPRVGLLLGYARMKENDIREGIRRLHDCF